MHSVRGGPETTARAGQGLRHRERVARFLSDISSARGVSVSTSHFEVLLDQTEPNTDGDSRDVIRRVWTRRFPRGEVSAVPARELSKHDLPSIFVGSDGDLWLVRSVRGGVLQVSGPGGGDRVLTGDELSCLALTFGTGEDQSLGGEFGVPDINSGDWFRAAFRAHGPLYRDVVLASLLISLLGIVSAIYTMQVYDRVVPTGAFSTLFVLTVGVLISVALEAIGRQLKTFLIQRSSDRIDQHLSQLFFQRALSLRMESRPGSVGTLASQIRGYEVIRQYMTASFLFLFADLPFAFIFLVFMGVLAGPIVVVPLILIPVGVFIGLALRGPIERYTAMNVEESNRRNGLLVEALDGAETMKSAGAEWEIGERWRLLTQQVAHGDLKVKFFSYLAVNLSQLLQQLTYVGIIAAGSFLVSEGEVTVGALIACSILSGRALGALSQFPNVIVQGKQAKIALSGLDQMMSVPTDWPHGEPAALPDSLAGELRCERVGFGYGPESTTLTVASLQIGPGERVAVLGPSGSGKTTLMRVLSGLYHPTTGSVFLDHHDIALVQPDFVREVIGYVPQDVRLFSGTLRDNLTLGLPNPSEEILAGACEATRLSSVIAAHPLGLGLPITEGGLGLSAGQRQLVALTRALIARPRILLLDEPTASMDKALEGTILDALIRSQAPEVTVVVVTHKTSVLDYCDRVLVLDAGRIILDGPKPQVLEALSGKRVGGS